MNYKINKYNILIVIVSLIFALKAYSLQINIASNLDQCLQSTKIYNNFKLKMEENKSYKHGFFNATDLLTNSLKAVKSFEEKKDIIDCFFLPMIGLSS